MIEQAKGVAGELLNINMDESFVLLKAYARDNNQRLRDVAERVVNLPLTRDDDLTAELESISRRLL